MALKAGDMFVTIEDTANPNSISAPMKCVKLDRDYVYAEGFDTKEYKNVFNRAFCIPAEYEPQMRAIAIERQSLKKAYDNSMSLVYKLLNEISTTK